MSYNNRYSSNFYRHEKATVGIIYQMVDNNFPLSSEGLQKEIEKIPLCKGETTFYQKYNTRYIKINVCESMTKDEIFNFGKRISIIEQKLILKSQDFVAKTVNLNISDSHLKFIKSLLFSLNALNFDENIKDISERIKKYLKTSSKTIKPCKTKEKSY